MKKKVLFLLLFLLLVNVNLVSAPPPTEQTFFMETGIQIETPIFGFIEQSKPFLFHIHAHNVSNGLLLANDTISFCEIHIFNNSGEHFVLMNMTYDFENLGWEINVLKGNFSRIGSYDVLYYCEVPNEIGGFLEYDFKVTPTGQEIEKPESNFYFIMIFAILLLFGIFFTAFLLTPYENKKEKTKEGEFVVKVTLGKYIKLFSFWISYGLFLWFMAIITGISNNYIFFEGLKDMISSLYRYLSILGIGLNLSMSLFLIWLTWRDIILNREIINSGKAFIRELQSG